MTLATTESAEVLERARVVEEALHSGAMEGCAVSAATDTDAQEYVDGSLDADALVARARARHGLG